MTEPKKKSAGAREGVAASSRRWPAIFRRWLFTAVVEAAAASAFLLGAALLGETVASVLQWMDATWKWVASAVVLLSTIIGVARSGILGNLGVNKAHVNPPRWLQVVIFVAVVIAAWSHFPTTIPTAMDMRISAALQAWGLLAAGALLLASIALVVVPHLAALLRRRRATGAATVNAGLDLVQSDFKRICEWVRTDDEITKPDDDAFRSRRYSRARKRS